MKAVNELKDEIQRQAHAIWLAAGRKGTVAAGTGFGKSRIAVLEVERMQYSATTILGVNNTPPILLVCSTEKMRDVDWPREFLDWGIPVEATDLLVKRICFASLKNEVGNHYLLVLLDEAHRLTELSAQAFTSEDRDALDNVLSFADAVLALTATFPDKKTEKEKYGLLSEIAPVVFSYTLDQGVSDGMINDYEIRVIMHPLDDSHKIIPAGTKAKSFLVTEKKAYEYLNKKISKAYIVKEEYVKLGDITKAEKQEKYITTLHFKRNHFLIDLPSKQRLAERCIKHILGKRRTLIFAGSITQAEHLLPGKTYHSKTGSDAFDAFAREEINELIAVKALDEGVTIPSLSQLLLIAFDSSVRRMVQRVGRGLRLTESGDPALVYILCTQSTQEEKWLDNALSEFDPSKIKYFSSKNVPA